MAAGILFGILGSPTDRDNIPEEDRSPGSEFRQDSTRKEIAAYTGSRRCVECHPKIAEEHGQHGHSQTFRRGGESDVAWLLDGASVFDEERNREFTYELSEDGLFVRLPSVFPDREFPLDYAFGSGLHAVTFLTLVPSERSEVVGVEHRISWITYFEDFRLTPGHERQQVTSELENFGTIKRDRELHNCLDCHTSAFRLEGAQLAEVVPNVGCESCHGPGRAHAEAAERRESPVEMPFAAGTATASQQIELCGECHRTQESIDPKRIRRDSRSIVRFQPVGLVQSECYRKGDGRLGCLSCHSPHSSESTAVRAKTLQQCTSCHSAEASAVCPIDSRQGCIECHMPAVEIHPGLSFHDHWIRVRSGDENSGTSSGERQEP